MPLLPGTKDVGLASLSPVGRFSKVHPKRVASLYFGIGADDGRGMRRELHRFIAGVRAARPPGVRLGYREFDGEGHMSAPLRTFWRGMECIIADPRLPDAIIEHFTTRAFLAQERMLRARYGAAARQAQEINLPLGPQLIRNGDCDGAIAVLKRIAEAYAGNRYPRNNAGLASACAAAGRTAEAEYRRAYRLAVETGYGEADSDRKKIAEPGGHVA